MATADSAKAKLTGLVENSPFGRFQWTVFTIVLFSWIVQGLGGEVQGLLFPSMASEPWVKGSEMTYGSLISAGTVGGFLGTTLAALLCDIYGRLAIALAFSIISTASLAGFAASHAFIPAALFFFGGGVGGGGLGFVLPVILAEWLPLNNRGQFLAQFQFGWPVGGMLSVFLMSEFYHSWRTSMWIITLLNLLLLVLLLAFLSESPLHLIATSRFSQARVAIEDMYKANQQTLPDDLDSHLAPLRAEELQAGTRDIPPTLVHRHRASPITLPTGVLTPPSSVGSEFEGSLPVPATDITAPPDQQPTAGSTAVQSRSCSIGGAQANQTEPAASVQKTPTVEEATSDAHARKVTSPSGGYPYVRISGAMETEATPLLGSPTGLWASFLTWLRTFSLPSDIPGKEGFKALRHLTEDKLYRDALISMTLLMFFLSVASTGIRIWVLHFLQDALKTDYLPASTLYLMHIANATVILGSSYALERYGRMECISAGAWAATLFTLALVLPFRTNPVILGALVILSVCSQSAAWIPLNAVSLEIFPTESRSSGLLVLRLAQALGGFLAPILGACAMTTFPEGFMGFTRADWAIVTYFSMYLAASVTALFLPLHALTAKAT